MPDEPLWTADDVARFLGVSSGTVRCWQRAHRLPFIKVGGTVRFPPEEIRRWVDVGRRRNRSSRSGAKIVSPEAVPVYAS